MAYPNAGLKLICRLGWHYWHYTYQLLEDSAGVPFVLITRHCRECGRTDQHNTTQYNSAGAPIWENVKQA